MRWLLVILFISFAGCVGQADPVDMNRPTWEPGYAWSYAFDDRHVHVHENNGAWDNITAHDAGRRIVEILNSTKHHVAMQLVDGESLRKEVVVFRSRDLASLDTSYRGYAERCDGASCKLEPGILDVEEDAATFIEFPLSSGHDWRTVGDTYVTTGVVESGAIVDTELGSVTAAKIVLETIPLQPDALAKQLRTEAERQGFDMNRVEVEEEIRDVVYYSDEYLAVVQRERRETRSIFMEGTDAEGAPFSMRDEETRILREILDGARLVPRPARSVDDLAKFLTGRLDVRDPAGQAVSGGGFELAILGGNLTVNAADAPHLTYLAEIDGTLGEGDLLQWQLVDADSNVLAEAQGTRFDVNLTLPGRLTVEIEALRGGDVIAAAGVPLIADWRTNVTRDCGPVSASGNPAACPVIYVPVHTGIQEVSIALVPTGPNAQTGGHLWLHDPAGGGLRADFANGAYRIHLDDFEGYSVGNQAWRLTYSPHAGLATTISAAIELRYSG